MKWGIVAALALVTTAGCDGKRGHGPPEDQARPIEVLVPGDPETLDPRYVTDAVGMRVSRLIHAGLTRVDPTTLRAVPYLASSLRWTGPLTLEVTLREGLRFHGGAPFEAEDVVATLHAFGSAAVGSRHVGSVEPMAEVVATGPHDLRIVLKRPHATLATDLELPILRRDQAASPPDETGALLDGLGPYEIERSERGEILLRPAQLGVRGGAPAREWLAVRTVHDENARAVRLYSGRADVALNGISPTLLPALEGRAGLSFATCPGANLTYLVVRVDRGPLADVSLRRAISFAIDRQTLADYLFGRRATPADSLLPERHWARRDRPPALAAVRFDPDAARALVRAMGTPPGRLTLLTSTDRLRGTVARTMAEELGAVGLDVEVVPLELGTLIARLNAGDFDMASLQIPELTEPNVLRVFLHSAYIPPAGSNRGRVRDPELDSWLELGDTAQGEEERARAYAGVDARIADALFIIPLWHEDQVAVVSPRARGFQPSPEGRWLSLAELP